MTRWVAAQNDGDFEGYRLLYAERFVGIKRSGQRATQMPRASWLRDRQRMFAKAMQVRATDLVVSTGTTVATATFTQTWQSGSYRDVGPKQIVVVRDGTELRIAREEMLASTVDRPDDTPTLDSADFAFVDHFDASYVVLRHGAADVVARGAVKLHAAAAVAAAGRRVLDADVPELWRPWIGRGISIYNGGKVACRGQVVHLELMARVAPHFGTLEHWATIAKGDTAALAAVADDIWDMGQGGLALVGRVVPVGGASCSGGYWARADDRPAVVPLAEAGPDPLLQKRAQTAFRALRGWATVQKEFASAIELPRVERWDQYGEAVPLTIAFDVADGSERLLWLSVAAGDGCGDFRGDLSGLWRVRGVGAKATLQLLSDDLDPGRTAYPKVAVDLDGDGRAELIGHDAVLVPVGPTWRLGPHNEIPSLDCPC